MTSHAPPTDDTDFWLSRVLSGLQTVAYAWSPETDAVRWSDPIAEMLELDGDVPPTRRAFLAYVDPADRTRLEEITRHVRPESPPFQLAYRIRGAAGRILHVHESGRLVHDPVLGMQVLGILQCRDESSVISGASQGMGVYHPLFAEVRAERPLHRMVQEAIAAQQPGAFLVMSIDNMPMLIAAYGRTRAEAMVQEIAEYLSSKLPSGAQVQPVQHNEIGVFIPHCTMERKHALVQELPGFIRSFAAKDTASLYVVVSVAGTQFPEEAHHLDAVIDTTYQALEAKHQQNYKALVQEAYGEPSPLQQMEMATFLHRAIHGQKLLLAYQPIIDTQTGGTGFYECLLRLQGEDGHITSAGGLVPIAEKLGLIDQIDQMVLEMVVEDLLRNPDVVLSFNISSLTVMNREWYDTLERIARETPEICPRMIVEITETAAQQDIREAAYFVASVQGLGCRVALDDFGAGYTSFRQLRALSCDIVKIDGNFVRDMLESSDNRLFVQTLLEFTHGYGLHTVAEHVETGDVAKALMQMGVHYMQGYYFGKAVTERVWL